MNPRPLKLLFYFFSTIETGLGHHFRSLALAQAAHNRGHCIYIASNRKPPSHLNWIEIPEKHYLKPIPLYQAIQAVQPDWLIVDLPHVPPTWIRERVAKNCKILTLNGIGYNQGDGADLRVIQGCAEVNLPGEQDKVPVLKGLEYIILRPEIERHRSAPRGEYTLVWGGGADGLGLLQAFADWFPEERAYFLIADMTPIPLLTSPNHWLLQLRQDSDDFFWWLARAKRLVCCMGMCVPEAIFLHTPTYCVNYSELHLTFSTPLADQGLIKNYPAVGLPSREEMERFLREPFKMAENKLIGTEGALRVMRQIEERS